jgi:hypothetical protein
VDVGRQIDARHPSHRGVTTSENADIDAYRPGLEPVPQSSTAERLWNKLLEWLTNVLRHLVHPLPDWRSSDHHLCYRSSP